MTDQFRDTNAIVRSRLELLKGAKDVGALCIAEDVKDKVDTTRYGVKFAGVRDPSNGHHFGYFPSPKCYFKARGPSRLAKSFTASNIARAKTSQMYAKDSVETSAPAPSSIKLALDRPLNLAYAVRKLTII